MSLPFSTRMSLAEARMRDENQIRVWRRRWPSPRIPRLSSAHNTVDLDRSESQVNRFMHQVQELQEVVNTLPGCPRCSRSGDGSSFSFRSLPRRTVCFFFLSFSGFAPPPWPRHFFHIDSWLRFTKRTRAFQLQPKQHNKLQHRNHVCSRMLSTENPVE